MVGCSKEVAKTSLLGRTTVIPLVPVTLKPSLWLLTGNLQSPALQPVLWPHAPRAKLVQTAA